MQYGIHGFCIQIFITFCKQSVIMITYSYEFLPVGLVLSSFKKSWKLCGTLYLIFTKQRHNWFDNNATH